MKSAMRRLGVGGGGIPGFSEFTADSIFKILPHHCVKFLQFAETVVGREKLSLRMRWDRILTQVPVGGDYEKPT